MGHTVVPIPNSMLAFADWAHAASFTLPDTQPGRRLLTALQVQLTCCQTNSVESCPDGCCDVSNGLQAGGALPVWVQQQDSMAEATVLAYTRPNPCRFYPRSRWALARSSILSALGGTQLDISTCLQAAAHT